jgi:two-component sensor histidine kinase
MLPCAGHNDNATRSLNSAPAGAHADASLSFRSMMEALPTAAFASDRGGRVTWFNAAATAFWGKRPSPGALWQDCFRPLLHPDGTWAGADDLPVSAALLSGHKARGRELVFERPDHSRVWFVPESAPLQDGSGLPTGVITLLMDVSARREVEEAQLLVFGELKHRLKNAMATIQAIAAQTFHDASKAERELFAARLRALGDVHELLLRDQNAHATVTELLARALAPFQGEFRFTVSGPPVALPPNDCLLFSMVVHELVTNAIKYGALSAQGGVEITWTVQREGRPHLRFRWEEHGGPNVEPPTRRSFGTALIERAFRSTASTSCLRFLPAGVVCELDVAL